MSQVIIESPINNSPVDAIMSVGVTDASGNFTVNADVLIAYDARGIV